MILLNTSTNVNSSESGDDTFYWANGGVENYGIIASTNLAGFTDPDAGNGTGNLRPVYEARSTVRDDLFDSSLGSSFVVDGDFTDALVVLNEGGVAGDHLITSTVGGVEVDNDYHGILFGTVDLTGSNGTGESGVGNSIWNYGSWFTEGLNTLTSTEGDSSINNEGLIQTAFGSESDVPTTFDVANFYNDSPAPNENGYLSMVDGLADNDIVVTGNFWGSQDETLAHSYLAVDAYLASATDTDPVPTADQLHIDGSVTGTTGIIVNNTNTDNEGMGPNNTPGILVVSVAGEDPGACVDLACQDGDSFYISSKSANYLDVNGHGAIQQGLYAWYLHNQEDEGGSDGLSDYYLVTAALPTATSTPEVLTAFDNIFFDGVSGVVSDHLYGDHFAAPNSSPNTANSGGDVPPLGNADDHSKTNAAVWGRVAGSWSTQDSSYSSTYGGDFDTSFRQNTYTLLGGVDMSPNGDGDGLRFGAYGGYLGSNQNFDNYGTTGKYTGGVIGGYAAYTSGGFYADAQVNADLLSVKYDATLGTPVDATTTGTTIGVMANVGDRMYSGKNFFEPVASFGYATTNLNSFQSGTATVDFSNGQSVRAGAGARIGTTMAIKGGTLVEFALLGKIWDEFSGNNTVTITDSSDPGNPDTFTNDTGGVFGEVSGSATLFDPKTNVSTYLSAGGTFKSDATSWNAKLGLRKGF
ncbi:MAG: autotransporter outer membrane beta-barrel domain-containing protein [Bauldia sp.]